MTDEPVALAIAQHATPDFVDAVHDALEELWRRVPDVGDEDRMLFALAMSEIATNVVSHAEGRELIEVRVTITASDDALTAVFTDTADPALIDLGAVSMPGAEAESGRGLALALAALDELTHDTDDGNTWRLARRRSPRA